jgi:CBS domain-containing protein
MLSCGFCHRRWRPGVKVQDIMTRDPVTVTSDTTFKEIVERLVRSDVGSLPVVDAQGTLLGLVSEADLICTEAYGGTHRRALAVLADLLSARDHRWATKASGSTAGTIMSKKLIVCHPHEDVRAVARRMVERGVKHMPVVHADSLVGIVSRHDVLKMFDRPDDEIAKAVQEVLSEDANMPDNCQISSSVDRGVVTLTGDVRYEWDVPIVVSKIRDVPGVIEVDCRLRHREPNPHPHPHPQSPFQPWTYDGR